MIYLIIVLSVLIGVLIGAMLFIPRPVKKEDTRNLRQRLNIEV